MSWTNWLNHFFALFKYDVLETRKSLDLRRNIVIAVFKFSVVDAKMGNIMMFGIGLIVTIPFAAFQGLFRQIQWETIVESMTMVVKIVHNGRIGTLEFTITGSTEKKGFYISHKIKAREPNDENSN